ncbi:MAG: hypothetical protein J0I20_02880 [Chloroflexi bacterium]|nr:hypothetical protein [Chloroflexota bacterium]OJV89291.1 MAG: hypothetical protein BGO39_35465 [Chloroflexi bacterium 54-19]
MKFFTVLNLKKLPVKPFNGPVLTYFSLSVMLLSLFILLTACSDRKPATVVPNSTTANVPPAATRNVPAMAPAPLATTAAASTIQPSFADNRPVTDQSGLVAGNTTAPESDYATPAPSERPALSLSPGIIQVGQSVEISGTGYPANTRLNIRVASPGLGMDTVYASVVTDATGAFTTTLTLENPTKTTLLTPGKVEFLVTTPDNQIGASIPLALQPSADASQDETCKNLVLEFFATLKRDSGSAQVYLSTDLRSRILSGKTSLNNLLGAQNPPLRVDVTKVKGPGDSYQATMYFSGGEQKSVVLDVSTDVSGALKISAIHSN